MKRKKEAIIEMESLFAKASHSPAEVAAKLVRSAIKISMRNKVRIPQEFRRKFCQSCFTFWRGDNVQIRTRSGRTIMTCKQCNTVRRFPMRKERIRK